MKKVTAVIVTYKRPDIVKLAIESLVNQTVSHDKFDVIVVNNAPEDTETSDVIKQFSDKYINVKEIIEERMGVSFARNRGLEESDSEYIAYMDDDAIAPDVWIEQILEIIKKDKPDIFGGPIYPYYLNEKPDWFKDEYEIREKQEKTGPLVETAYLSGANFILKIDVLKELGGFNTAIGMKGRKIAYHEEPQLQIRAREKGIEIMYYSHLKMTHHVPVFKQTIQYQIFSAFQAGKDGNELWGGKYSFEDYLKAYELVGQTLDKLSSFTAYDHDKYKYFENYIVEELRKDFVNIGDAYGYFSRKSFKVSDVVNNIERLSSLERDFENLSLNTLFKLSLKSIYKKLLNIFKKKNN